MGVAASFARAVFVVAALAAGCDGGVPADAGAGTHPGGYVSWQMVDREARPPAPIRLVDSERGDYVSCNAARSGEHSTMLLEASGNRDFASYEMELFVQVDAEGAVVPSVCSVRARDSEDATVVGGCSPSGLDGIIPCRITDVAFAREMDVAEFSFSARLRCENVLTDDASREPRDLIGAFDGGDFPENYIELSFWDCYHEPE